jgi:hypothetical protein
MQIISIDIPDETIALEISRPPEAMHYEDFIWCIGVNFNFEDKKLTINAPLLGFMKKLIDAKARLEEPRPCRQIVIQDEDQSYEICISHIDDAIRIQEAFSNAVASLPAGLFWTSVRLEYREATNALERAIPGLLENAGYRILKSEIQKGLV